MKLYLILYSILLVLPCVVIGERRLRRKCRPKYHYWKPYVATGNEPKDAFPIGVPKNYTRTYIARVTVPYKKWSRVVPAQLIYDHVESPSIYGVNGTVERYSDGIELLHVTDRSIYEWIPVYWDQCKPPYTSQPCYQQTQIICQNIMTCCCLVEGGITWEDSEAHQIYYIGRVIEGGKIRVGRVLMRKNKRFGDDIGIFYLSGWDTKNKKSNFDVLAYDCNTKIPTCSDFHKKVAIDSQKLKTRWFE